MDRTMRILLSLAVAILYPVVIYFMVVTLVPRSADSKYPEYPSCYRYDNSSSRYSQSDCDREYREYDRKLESYQDSIDQEEEKNLTRAQLALGLALITIVGVVFLRDVKELAAGLTVGASVAVVGANTVLVAGAGDDPTVGNVLLILLSFAFLTAVLYLTEKNLPETTSAKQSEQ